MIEKLTNDAEEAPGSRPSMEKVQQSMQGPADVDKTQDWPSDHHFTDKRGHPITIRDYENGATHYLRAFDQEIRQPPDRVTIGDVGQANLHLEEQAGETKARLQDITVPPAQQGNGIGGELLSQAEKVSMEAGASEIYGSAPSDDQTRSWYEKRAYAIRQGAMGEEVFKTLASE